MFRLIQVSENTKLISRGFQKNHDEIPWKSISGLRNRIVHDYGAIDLKIIYDTVKEDVPILSKKFTVLFSKEDNNLTKKLY